MSFAPYHFILEHRKQLLLALTSASFVLHAFLLSTVTKNNYYHNPSVSLSITLLFELTKLAFSAILYFTSTSSTTAPAPAPAPLAAVHFDSSLSYAIPAIIYMINDNLLFIIYGIIPDPAVVSVLLSLRILSTTVAFRLFLSRIDAPNLTTIQAAAMILLTLGTAASQITTCGDMLRAGIPLKGAIVVALYCALSAFASVFVEYLFKRGSSDSFYLQNVQMYAYGVLFNGVVLLALYGHELHAGLLEGKNALTVALVLNNAVGGLAVAALVKYASTIEKVYAHSVSMIITLLASTIVLGNAPTAQLVFGSLIVTISIYIYYIGEGGKSRIATKKEHV